MHCESISTDVVKTLTLVICTFSKLLASLTVQYFRSDESIGERSTCIVTGLIYFLLAMIAVILPERTLEVGLNTAYQKFNEGAAKFLDEQGVSSTGPASKVVLLFCIAVCSGVVGELENQNVPEFVYQLDPFPGAIFTFPGLRMAKMHFDSLKYCKEKPLLKLILNINFALPFLLVLLWIKPVGRDLLTTSFFGRIEQPL